MTGDRPLGPLGELVLARETVDRATERRTDQAWLDTTWADPDTRVLVVDHGRALVRLTGDSGELVFISPAQAPPGIRFLLGVEDERTVYYGVSAPLEGIGSPPDAAGARGTGPGRDRRRSPWPRPRVACGRPRTPARPRSRRPGPGRRPAGRTAWRVLPAG